MKPIAVVFAAALLFAAAKITKSSAEEGVGTPVVDTSYIQQDETGTPKYTSDYRSEIIRERSPLPAPLLGSNLWSALEAYSEDIVLLIHTVNENEFWAAVDHFGPPACEPELTYDDGTPVDRLINFLKVRMFLGTFGSYKSALIQTKMGADCRNEIEQALQMLPNVQAVIAVGIAYGKDREDLMYGDVMVSTWIEDISNVKFAGDGQIRHRGEMTMVRPILVDIFSKQQERFAVETGFVLTKEGRPPNIEDGIMVSAPWLIDNNNIKKRLLETTPEAVGGEMEGWVLISIQKKNEEEKPSRYIGVIVIKAVSDFADGSKDRRWQMSGSMASVGYAEFQLKQTQGQAFAPYGEETGFSQEAAILGMKPELAPILTIVDNIQPRWEELAMYLQLNEDTIQALADDHIRTPSQKVIVVFDQWLNGEGRKDKKWSVVLQFLSNMEPGVEVANKMLLAIKE